MRGSVVALGLLCGLACQRKAEPPPPADAAPVVEKKAPPALPPDLLYELGKQRLAAGKTDEAIRAFDQVIAANVSVTLSANALLAMGAAYTDKGDAKNALAAYQRLVALRPQDVEARRVLGVAFENAGALARAAEELEKAVFIAHDELVVYQDLARVYRRQKKDKESLAALGRYEIERTTLVKALGLDKDPKVRAAAAERLAGVPDDETGRALTLALDDRVPAVRVAVARSLGEHQYLAAKGPLKALAEKDTDATVRDAAADALDAIAKAAAKAPAPRP